MAPPPGVRPTLATSPNDGDDYFWLDQPDQGRSVRAERMALKRIDDHHGYGYNDAEHPHCCLTTIGARL